jgi:serine protease Do
VPTYPTCSTHRPDRAAVPAALLATLLIALLLPSAASAQSPNRARDDVETTLAAVVRVQAKIPPGARSAATLGADRQGSGVLIRDGYVLTIGYLVSEAETIEVATRDGVVVPARLAGYDHPTGLGLLKLAAPLSTRPLPLGDPTALAEQQPAMILTHAGRESAQVVQIVSRRRFTGNWEYMLDSAIFTAPAVPNWSGAALISPKGELLGIGSLIVGDAARQGVQSPGNMFVPIDLLKPILEDLVSDGRRRGAVRPWLGVNADEFMGHLFVSRVSAGGPAALAGLQPGDVVVAVGEQGVTTLADFYRRVWSSGAAGVEVPLRVLQGTQVKEIRLRSIDRDEYFRAPRN